MRGASWKEEPVGSGVGLAGEQSEQHPGRQQGHGGQGDDPAPAQQLAQGGRHDGGEGPHRPLTR